MKEFPGQVGIGLLTCIQRNENGDCFLQSPDRNYIPIFLRREYYGQRSWAGYSPCGLKSGHVLAISSPSPHVKDGSLLAFV